MNDAHFSVCNIHNVVIIIFRDTSNTQSEAAELSRTVEGIQIPRLCCCEVLMVGFLKKNKKIGFNIHVMKHHYAIESCTQATLYYYYAVDMKVNAPDHKPQANSLTVKPLVLKSVILNNPQDPSLTV